jgi:hypothetical protein
MPAEESSLPLHTVMAVRPGKTTEVLARAEDAPEDLCFSLVSPARTLDIQTSSVEQRDMLLRGFQVSSASSHAQLLFFPAAPSAWVLTRAPSHTPAHCSVVSQLLVFGHFTEGFTEE